MTISDRVFPKSAILTVLALLLSMPVLANAQTAGEDDWSATFVLYLLGPTLDGSVGIGPGTGDVDMGAGDVFSMLDSAFLGIYAGEGERWGVDISGPGGILRGEVGNKQLTGLVSASYRVSERTRLLAGLMYTDITADIRITGPINPRYAKTSESWVDPVVGVAFNTPFGARWDFTALAQVGGGVSADLAYGLTASFAWKFGQSTSLTLGYRYLYFDYEDGSGAGRFKFDMKQHGPAIGFRFNF